MQYRLAKSLAILGLATQALAAYVPSSSVSSAATSSASESWTTLTPSASASDGAVTDYASTFGIAIQTISTSSGSSAAASGSAAVVRKRDVEGATTASGTSAVTTVSATETATSASSSSTSTSNIEITSEACLSDDTLALFLSSSILTDSKGRIGSIVANYQFQFDGPPPQAGAIYAAGWAITESGLLSLGSNDTFYQCLSGDFYNLYNEDIGSQCSPIHLEIVALIDC
ncbi:hypothetical protein PACTADRAFT_48665 [Pachysolen tannophilus NRRL Y-2460]|uniref:Cell wall mannoprotein PIR1-like C-terminal domain-containing protein n=1 Tax=Pachysolen tannophilus NRRL Y-2460 TaxID=669874 RepID=A0A1E4TYM6_PACTA|nr:hypothetical protein PACTADRAFT_48665 [Pachysolen tannophilus NRRL Y-2460]